MRPGISSETRPSRGAIKVGQIWDDVFGKWTHLVVAVTDHNVVLRRLEYGNETFIETLVPVSTFDPGRGWRLIGAKS